MVEIRKFLDHNKGHGKQFEDLRTYCDWVVHVHLDRSGAKHFIKSLARYLVRRGEHGAVTNAQFDAVSRVVGRFSLSHFKKHLKEFLVSEGLPTKLTDDGMWWGMFLQHYVSVVSDCPIIYEKGATRAHGLKRVTLIFQKEASNAVTTKQTTNVVFRWELQFADGTVKQFTHTHGYAAQQ